MSIAEILARKRVAAMDAFATSTKGATHTNTTAIEIGLREAFVPEEDIEHVAAEMQKNISPNKITAVVNKTDYIADAARSILKAEGHKIVEAQAIKKVVDKATKTNGAKPSNLLDLLRDYATVEMLRESSVWNLLSLQERIKLNKEYVKQRQLSGEERTMLTPEHRIGDDVKAATAEATAALERIPEPETHELTLSEKLFMRYPSFKALQDSNYYRSLNIADKVMVSREYAKQAQLIAMEAQHASRVGEKAMEQAEVAKALEQGADKALNDISKKNETFSLDIVLNERQQLGVEYAKAGKSFVFTGAAGTGKTTGCREIARALLQRGDLGRHYFKVIENDKTVSRSGPGIAFCAYTRRATSNIRRALHRDATLEKELEHNVVTIHRLLEYEPEFYTTPDDPTKQKMRFVPKRTAHNPITCKVIVIEEASMLGLDLWEKLYDAMLPGTVLIFVGDINQLPPVFGKSIMNYALAQLPIVELTEVYRQALDSGVIVDAHRVLKGLPPEGNKDVAIVEGKSPTQVGQEKMSRAMGAFFKEMWTRKEYDPNQDIILSPWNKQYMGTDNINNWIAQFLGEERSAMVYEVLTNRRKMYLAVGDRVMFEKQDGIIVKISHNAQYLGKMPQPASTALTRFGLRKMAVSDATTEDFELSGIGYENINIDEVPDEERKAQASHLVTLRMDSGEEETLSSVGDFAEQKFSLGYCLTVHKAQGCEWRKVYILLHKDHTLGGFLSRELIYTAMTRAREKLVLITKKALLAKAVQTQVIKGNTLEEKVASINSGATNIGQYKVVKT